MNEDLRRITRVSVCCRVVVRDRYGVWTAVTEDVSNRGCQLVTARLLRPGTLVNLTLSSDLFAEDLDTVGQAVWATSNRLGVAFVGAIERPGTLSPAEWVAKVIEVGEIPDSSTTWRVAPSVLPAAARTILRPIRRA